MTKRKFIPSTTAENVLRTAAQRISREDFLVSLSSPILSQMPERLSSALAWTGHIPFLAWYMAAARPRVFVELGTHSGVSYCAGCQAVRELKLDTKCFAVDTWRGDGHAGFYGEEVYEDLVAHHDPRYGAFSHLYRMTFDDAVKNFEDGSIDLLHIDGLHTYEAVRHDFESWQSKMSIRGVVLFHDTAVRDQPDFGVWRLWEELSGMYPSFEFLHSFGLGVLSVGEELPTPLHPLFEADAGTTQRVRDFFANVGKFVTRTNLAEGRCKELEATIARLHASLERKGAA